MRFGMRDVPQVGIRLRADLDWKDAHDAGDGGATGCDTSGHRGVLLVHILMRRRQVKTPWGLRSMMRLQAVVLACLPCKMINQRLLLLRLRHPRSSGGTVIVVLYVDVL